MRVAELTAISRSLKEVAKELECPVVCLAQLSQTVESRADKRPVLSDIAEIGKIERDMDLIMLLYRDAYYAPDPERKDEAEIIVAKQTDGSIGMVNLNWQPSTVRFVGRKKV